MGRMTQDAAGRLKGIQLRIRGDHPFFGTLSLFANFVVSDVVKTAATDGRTIWLNPVFIGRLGREALCGLVIHELLHVALQHCGRRLNRDPRLWNIAADVVVNGMIRRDTNYSLPAGGVEIPKLGHLSVEEVYEQVSHGRHKLPEIELLDLAFDDACADDGSGAMILNKAEDLRRYWSSAIQQAAAVASRMSHGFGKAGLGSSREYEQVLNTPLDWKSLLWEFMVSTPYDFAGFDRRFLHQKIYLEEAVGEFVQILICIDTSASVGNRELGMFMTEIQSILDVYPQVQAKIFFADATLVGPFPFSVGSSIPQLVGGGGTSFVPFFDWVQQQLLHDQQPICIYFTDGLGDFPSNEPDASVLWIVTSGGLASTGFPFGKVARLGSNKTASVQNE